MLKRPDETYLEYKNRVIDSKSKSFCGAKWYNATIWLGSGKTTSCHHPPAHSIDIHELKNNPSAIHNTTHKKAMRKMMQAGERPLECEYCWKIEDMDRNAVSDRVFKTVIYDDSDLDFIFKADYEKNIHLKTLEIAFDRTCQFACSYCNPNFSTTWARDIKKNGAYKGLQSDGAEHFTTDGDESDLYSRNETNPFVEAFWRWWPELSTHLQELRLTGGEPLMSSHTWTLLEYFKDHPELENMALAVNSNLGASDEIIEKFIEKSRFVKRLILYTSGEASGTQGEYIRDGLVFNTWLNNFKRVLVEGRVASANIMLTINALCIFSLTEFLDETLELKKKFDPGYVNWSVNILRFPSFQSVLTLSTELRETYRLKLQTWCDQNFSSIYISEFEKQSLLRLVDYLDLVKTPHRHTSSLQILESDFKKFYQQYDSRRGKNFRDVFPLPVVHWYDSIKIL